MCQTRIADTRHLGCNREVGEQPEASQPPLYGRFTCDPTITCYERFILGGFPVSSDKSSSWFPLTQNFAKRTMMRSTISWDFATMLDLRLKRPHPCRGRQ